MGDPFSAAGMRNEWPKRASGMEVENDHGGLQFIAAVLERNRNEVKPDSNDLNSGCQPLESGPFFIDGYAGISYSAQGGTHIVIVRFESWC